MNQLGVESSFLGFAPYAFYISDQELVVQLGTYLQKNKGFKFSPLLAPTALLFGGTFLNDTYLAL